MTVEGRPNRRLIESGSIPFSEIELGVPMIITALDALTNKPKTFTVIPIGRYEGSLPTVAFRLIDGNDFSFSLFGQAKQPFQLPEGAEFIATASGHLIDRLDLNHHDKGQIQVGKNLDLAFEHLSEDQVHHFAANNVSRVSFGKKIEDFLPPDLTNFFQEIEAANRK